MPTQAEDFYAEIEAKTPAERTTHIEGWTTAGPVESEYLEYKTIERDTKVPEIWSKVLASFGNLDGGVLVWGVDARKGKAEQPGQIAVDGVQGLKPVPDPDQLVQTLKDNLRDSLNEPIHGIKYVTVNASTTGGYVVCFIPAGQNKPYRALRCKGQPYFQRHGDNTDIISHSNLRLMFFPRVSPSLQIVGRPGKGEEIDIAIRNVGTATAKNITVVVTYAQRWASVTHSHPDWAVLSDKDGVGNYVAVRPLHPEQTVELIRFHYTKEWEGRARPVVFGFRIYADDNASRLEWRVDETRERLMSEVQGYTPQDFTADNLF
jgi:hypothetical protein